MGHIPTSTIGSLNQQYNLGIPARLVTHTKDCYCSTCVIAKSKRTAIGTGAVDSQYKPKAIGEIIHFDLLGPITVMTGKGKYRLPSTGGNLYGLIGVDVYSNAVFVRTISSKSETPAEVIKILKALIVATGATIKRIHTDGGTEFMNATLSEFTGSIGIKHTCTTAGTPAHNGIAERMVRALTEKVRALLYQSKAPLALWGEALVFAAHLHNCLPNATTGAIPYQLVFGIKPNIVRSAKVFGCDCQFYVHQQERGKFEPKFRDGIHLGFDETRNGYRIRTVGTGVIVITRDAKFNETSFANVMELHKVPIRSLVSSLHSAIAPVAGMVDETALDTTTSEPTFISKPDGNDNTDTGPSGTNSNTTSQAPTTGANGSTPDLCYDYYDLTNGTSATGVNDETIDSNNPIGDSNTNDTHYDSLEPISPHSDGERKYDSDSDTSLAGVTSDITGVSDATVLDGTTAAPIPADIILSNNTADADQIGTVSNTTNATGESTSTNGTDQILVDGIPVAIPPQAFSSRGRILKGTTINDPKNYAPTDRKYIEKLTGTSTTTGILPSAVAAGAIRLQPSRLVKSFGGPQRVVSSTTTTTGAPAATNGSSTGPTLRSQIKTFGTNKPVGNTSNDKALLVSLHNQYGLVLLDPIPVPATYKQAMASPQRHEWKKAMDAEINALLANNTWELVPLPTATAGTPVPTPITCRWVFTIKRNADGTIQKYKARLVVRGFLQRYGVDYKETYAPVVKFKSIKLILAIAAAGDMELKQLDFSNAFLNAGLDELVYMEQPIGYHTNTTGTDTTPTDTGARLVCRLKRALYGLKQAPRAWFQEVNQFMISIGYKNILSDAGVYIKRTTGTRLILVCLYVDDTIIAYHKDDEPVWLADKKLLAGKYVLQDIGDCLWILHMAVVRDRTNRTITLTQEQYISDMLERFSMSECNPASNPCIGDDVTAMTTIPIATGTTTGTGAPKPGTTGTGKVTKQQLDFTALNGTDHELYRQIVGSILYAANTLRPDLAFAVGVMSRFVSAPAAIHLRAAKHCLRYLKGTKGIGLLFTGSATGTGDHSLVAFSDASWGNDLIDRKSTTGTLIKYNGNTISWLSKKQATVALSSMESEYMALSTTLQECYWFRSWIKEVFQVVIPVLVLCDNQAAICFSTNDGTHQRSKHIDIRYHFIRDYVADGIVHLQYIRTTSQEADILTKVMGTSQFITLRNQIMSTTTTGTNKTGDGTPTILNDTSLVSSKGGV